MFQLLNNTTGKGRGQGLCSFLRGGARVSTILTQQSETTEPNTKLNGPNRTNKRKEQHKGTTENKILWNQTTEPNNEVKQSKNTTENRIEWNQVWKKLIDAN
jgi:hypothetical protein